MLFDVTETDPRRDWSYLTEGGASVVFAYVGQQHPVCSGKALRVYKTWRQHLAGPDLPGSPNVHGEHNEDFLVAFQKSIISQLLPEKYLPDMQSVHVTNEWLFELAVRAEPFRPAVRKQGVIDNSRKVAVLVTNLVDKGLAVEIKPKWGFLPAPARLSPETLPFKTKHCRFCMHRFYKTSSALHPEQGFCPLDLFSGNEERIRKYLHSLWTSWLSTNGEINNLRIFYDGKVIRPTAICTRRLLSQHLLGRETADPPELASAFVKYLLPQILETDVFHILGHLQKTLDPLDIEGLVQLWNLSCPESSFGNGQSEPDLLEWKEFMDVYRSGGDLTLRHFLLAYLLSATFKDCSVITRRLNEKDHKVSVIDVGPKSIQRLEEWKVLDETILNHFMRLSESGPITPCHNSMIGD